MKTLAIIPLLALQLFSQVSLHGGTKVSGGVALRGGAITGHIITTFAGNGNAVFGSDNVPATSGSLDWPSQIVLDSAQNVYIADLNNNVIRVVNTQATTQTLYTLSVCSGCMRIIAGNPSDPGPGYGGDGGAATSADLSHPVGLAMDGSGNIYIADQRNNRIRKVTTGGIISTAVGSGPPGTCGPGTFSGDGGPATSAVLNCPQGVAVDAAGNIYVADSQNYRVRAVNTQGTTQTLMGVSIASGNIQTIAGTGVDSYSGGGSSGITTAIGYPLGMGFDGSGKLYIACYDVQRVLSLSTAGIINTFAGNGVQGYLGDGAAAVSAELNDPFDIKIDGSGNAWIADADNNVIRKVVSGIISTFAGDFLLYGTTGGFGGDGGPALLAGMKSPIGVATDTSGNLFIGDLENFRVRKVAP